MKRIVHIVEYLALRLLGMVLLVLPLRFTYLTARILGWFTFEVLRVRRGITLDNLTRSLGDRYSPDELVEIAGEAYRQIAMTLAEILVFPRLKECLGEIVEADEFQPLKKAREDGRGLIVATCHHGSWEMVGAALAARGIPMVGVGKTQSNKYVDRFIISRRAFMGYRAIPRGTSVKQLVQTLRNGEAIGLVSDQDAGGQGMFVSFFGRPASTPRGPAQLALKYRVPLFIVICERICDGRYRLINKELAIGDDDTVESLTARISAGFEKIIRQHPEQYFWMHRRWKTQVPLAPDIDVNPGARVNNQENGSITV
ncbi:lysophospholipid acyltransferase family protein [Candidatus Latescibacterota bacterium]